MYMLYTLYEPHIINTKWCHQAIIKGCVVVGSWSIDEPINVDLGRGTTTPHNLVKQFKQCGEMENERVWCVHHTGTTRESNSTRIHSYDNKCFFLTKKRKWNKQDLCFTLYQRKRHYMKWFWHTSGSLHQKYEKRNPKKDIQF